MNVPKLNGLIAATCTPLDEHGDIQVDAIVPYVDFLLDCGVCGLYVCGSTGEGMSLSRVERQTFADRFVRAVNGRVPVIIQVGHNSLPEARKLAAHAQDIGADAISATCPSYFKTESVSDLVAWMAALATSARDLPFYYYHIPSLTGSTLNVVDVMREGGDRIPSLVGLKYTDTKLHEFQQCLEIDEGRFDVVWGCDEMLLGALATGAHAAIGSTYNIAAPLYDRMIEALRRNDFVVARQLQSRSIAMIEILNRYPFHPALKAVLEMNGLDMGGCRLPLGALSATDAGQLECDLRTMGYFRWALPESSDTRA
ncbi:MAG: dihydrodipicolinate synthase family protein [Planctomycetota bacterium]